MILLVLRKMTAACTQPLVVPMHYDPSFKVDVRLHEPLLPREVTAADIEIDMMSLCSQLDILCKKEIFMQPDGKIEHGKVSSSFTNKATVVYDRMNQLIVKNPQINMTLGQYIISKGLDKLFPRAASYMSKPESLSLLHKKTSLDGYFHDLSALSHLCTLSQQMNNDLSNLTDHRYIAHQLAIFYQSMNSIGCPLLDPYKKSVEENFKAVKATLNSDVDGNKQLTDDQREWLLSLTSNLVQTLMNFPVDLTQEMIQPALVLYSS